MRFLCEKVCQNTDLIDRCAKERSIPYPYTREALKRFGNGSSKYASKNTSAHDLNPVSQDEGILNGIKKVLQGALFRATIKLQSSLL